MSQEKNTSVTARQRVSAGIDYVLTYKKVKGINLRVRPDGTVAVSAPRRVSLGQVDAFVAQNAAWVAKARERVNAGPGQAQDTHSDAECMAAFQPVLDRFYPLVAYGAPVKPALRVRFMKSRWGVCNLRKGYITLNKLLLDKPYPALEYVVLHELVHLIHPNHQAGFHKEMARLMPDYQQRRALLRQ